MSTATPPPVDAPRRTVGRTTSVVAGAGTVGPAVAAIIVHVWPSLADVEWAIAVIIGWAGAMLAGWILPPQRPAVVTPSPDEAGADFEGRRDAAPGERLSVG